MKTKYDKLASINFWRLPKYVDYSKVVAVKAAQASTVPVCLRNAFGGVVYFFRDCLIEKKTYVQEFRKSKFLLLFGIYNYRKDHQNTFLNFARCFQDADVIYSQEKSVEYKPLFLIKGTILFIVWLTQMLLGGVNLLYALNAIPFFLLCYKHKRLANEILENKYKFVVFYYDASPDESFLVQLLKHSGVETMTLQHGIFARKKVIKSITDTAFEISESLSHYYLAWNKYTKDEAIKVGLKAENVIVLGAPKYINYKEPTKPTCGSGNLFGVILNNSAFDYHNRKLIEMANAFSKLTKMNYILRYHPQMKGYEYKELYNEYFSRTDNRGQSIQQYAESVSFTIISSSSVLVDLLLLKHPAYRLKVFDEDTYSTVEFNSFSNAIELQGLIDNTSEVNPAFDYLCDSYSILQKYRSFFDEHLK